MDSGGGVEGCQVIQIIVRCFNKCQLCQLAGHMHT